jgi:hypothetical protein
MRKRPKSTERFSIKHFHACIKKICSVVSGFGAMEAERLLLVEDRRYPTLKQRRLLMPKKMEEKLKKDAKKKGLKGERADAYVYGTMRKTGWRPAREKK